MVGTILADYQPKPTHMTLNQPKFHDFSLKTHACGRHTVSLWHTHSPCVAHTQCPCGHHTQRARGGRAAGGRFASNSDPTPFHTHPPPHTHTQNHYPALRGDRTE